MILLQILIYFINSLNVKIRRVIEWNCMMGRPKCQKKPKFCLKTNKQCRAFCVDIAAVIIVKISVFGRIEVNYLMC